MSTPEYRRQYLQTPRGRELSQAQCKRWRENNREKYLLSMKKADLKRHYGLTVQEWENMFEEQDRRCAVCLSDSCGRKNGQWSTDHCHTSNKVRGILCNGCNLALGHTKDDPNRLRLLAAYLETGGASHAKS